MVADVTVVGVGVIGLMCAAELAERGMRVRLMGRAHRGEASSASGGMLAPSVEAEVAHGAAHMFAIASRERYPSYLAELEKRTNIPVPLNRLGILEVAKDDAQLAAIQSRTVPGARQLSAREVSELEPTLRPTIGGMLYPNDGCVDPLLLLDALRMLVAGHSRITIVTEDVKEIRVSNDTCEVRTDGESWCSSGAAVLAAGAWTGEIAGLPRPIPVEPVRGQMVAFDAAPLRHVVFGAGGYAIPKADGTTMVGSTMERVGFATETTEEGIEAVRAIGITLCTALDRVQLHAQWAGLRPMTPDLLPILGTDPEYANLIYACGHSRNGVLLAPLTGEAVADLVTGVKPEYDLHQFRPDRF